MSKHTPGPWKAAWRPGPHSDECLVGLADEFPFCLSGIIAKGRGFANDEVEANARLIAAAPDLLHNVEQAIKILERIRTDAIPLAMQGVVISSLQGCLIDVMMKARGTVKAEAGE